MRLLKLFILFVSVCCFTTVASAKQVFGLQEATTTAKHEQIKKTEPKTLSFINLLIEETDNSEDEDDTHEQSFFHLSLSSEFTYPHVGAIAAANAHLTFTKVSHNSTPLFIQFRNIRL
ncbi:MAG: hypothetical protein AABZ56_00770 [Bacteroidota bacterium]|jgi:hypothetical protein